MSHERNIDVYAAKLGDPNGDLKNKVVIATDLRDNIEYMAQGQLYNVFLKKLMPVFMKLLDGLVEWNSMVPRQRLRNCIFEILHRLPHQPVEALEPYAVEVVAKLMDLVRKENEDNAVLIMKIIMDFQRNQTKVLGDKVQPFLDLIMEMFEMMEKAVVDTFDIPAQGSASGLPSTPNATNFQSPRPSSPTTTTTDLGGEQQVNRKLLPGMQSFKVLAECPIIVVSLFQKHGALVKRNVSLFVPLIKGVLLLQAKPQQNAHTKAQQEGVVFAGVSPEIKNRVAFGDFITAQVKTMSFLAYLLRVYAHQLQDFLPTLPDIVVRLLQDCPREKSSARKELLVAIRHIINFNFRKIFLRKIDALLEERTLIGDGLTVYETMRPLAYSMLADLIHHVRDALKPEQIRKTVEVYTKNLHDDFPGTSFQTMSAKLLLNMADCIAKLNEKPDDRQDARHFLIMILDAIGDKFAAMNRQYPNAVKLTEQYENQTIDAAPENFLAPKDGEADWDEIDIFTAVPIKTSNPRDRSANPVAENKFLFKNLVNGLKNIFYQLKACNPADQPIDAANAPANWKEVSYGYNAEEVKVITKLFREGAYVFRYYSLAKPPTESNYSSPVEFYANHYMVNSGKEEKDLLEAFATIFHCIDPATFHEVFHSEIPRLYDMMFEHTALLHVPQFFLACESTSPSFAGMLLQFLMDRIHEVGSKNIEKSSILLRLFKLSFMAVTLFSNQNEQVLLPHVTKIVTKSIQLSTTAEEPMNYFFLLRSLFRSIGGGRFEHLYKEILPLLEMLLEVLNNLLLAARKPTERDLYVELCLTVPARLSNLLPHLSYLMRPLVIALRAGSDLVSQGLRTLELCVDNLTADYLDPIMAPVMDELMTALWEHLRPAPYTHFHSHTTMRILGKLGGRNRKFLNGPPALSFEQYADDRSSIDLKLVGSTKERPFPATLGTELAISKLLEAPKAQAAKKSDGFYKQQAFRLISAQLKLSIGFDSLPDDFAQLVRLQANDLVEAKYDSAADYMGKSEREKSIVKKDDQQDNVKKLLKACIFTVSIPDLSEEASLLLTKVCRHLTVLEVGRSLAQLKQEGKTFNVHSGEGPLFIDSRVLADAIVESFASDIVKVRDAAEQAIKTVYESVSLIFGSNEKVSMLPFFGHLARTFCHSCYEEEWFTKAGGSYGIHIYATELDLGDVWMASRQTEFVRALLYVMKDMPQDLPAKTRIQSQATLEVLLRRCNKHQVKDGKPVPRLLNLCGYLIYELAHMNRHVREAAQKAFSIIAEVTGTEVYVLMTPVKERLLGPIYNKPLRALPHPIQIGYIDAITFCLSLGHDLVEFNEPLNRLLVETLVLAESEDETLANRLIEYRTADNIVNLRVACIRLLSMAMSFAEFGNSPQNHSRSRIISVFFKSLYSKYSDVIDAANLGLKAVLSTTNKLPKELLQNGLRPILMNLQDPKRLTVAGLDGLARLLMLLTNYFKVEIGWRLLDHMKTIAEPNALQKISFNLVEQNQGMKIVAAILNIFYLLPDKAISFLPKLVDNVLELEEKLRRTHYSPFREPLVKYLNRYPEETWDFFSARLHEMKYGRFFSQILQDDSSNALRVTVTSSPDKILKAFMEPTNPEHRNAATVNAIHVVHSICIQPATSKWLVSQDNLRQQLFSAGKVLEGHLRKNTTQKHLRLAVEQAGQQLVEILTGYLIHAPQNVDFLFEMIEARTSEQVKTSYTFIKYIYDHIVCNDSIDYWRGIVTRCLDLYGKPSVSQKSKTFAFHYLVNPILAMDIMRHPPQKLTPTSPRLMDRNMTETINQKIWKTTMIEPGDDSSQIGVDHSRMELLQMSAMAIKYHHRLLQDARKEFIKFGWTYIKLEDVINKQAAYVVLSYFIAHFETPPKITLQIYVALLRAHQNEGRSLVTQSLELIAPVLPQRLAGAADNRAPRWAILPRRILSEESSNPQQMMSIFQFLVRHPALFYDSREQFVLVLIQSLPKIASPPTPSNETKKLALNVIRLIWIWEQRRVKGTGLAVPAASDSPNSKKRKLDASHDNSASPSATSQSSALNNEKAEYVIPVALRTSLIKYLIGFVSMLPERYPVPSSKIREKTQNHGPISAANSTEMINKSLQLLQDLLSADYWSDLDIKLDSKVFESLWSDKAEKPDERHTTRVMDILQVMRIILNTKTDEWIVSHLPEIQKLLEKPLRSDNAEIQDCLHTAAEDVEDSRKLKPIVKRILDAVPIENQDEEEPDAEAPTSEFVTFLSAIATETLSAGNHISSINILWTLSKRKPSEMDQHIPHVMKALQQKLARDHVAAHSAPPVHQGGIPTPTPPTPDQTELEIQTELILKTVDLVALRMSALGDQRRPFLSVLASLVEKSQSTPLCMKILDMVEVWIFSSNDPFPTLKEKTAVLLKMLLFEQRPDQTLLTRFLNLVLRIYEDNKIKRSELTVRLEHAFLVGTRAQDVEMRNRFLTIFEKSLTKTATSRLNYILTVQHWDVLGESFWLHQATQLMFGSVEMGTPVQLHHEDFRTFPASAMFSNYAKDPRKNELMLEETYEECIAKERDFCKELGEVKARDIFEPLCQLQHLDPNVSHDIWTYLFPLCWSAMSKEERAELERGIVTLITKDHHNRQVDRRPNVIQTLLHGVAKSRPTFKIPPHVLKFVSKTYDAWYTATCMLEEAAIKPNIDSSSVRESNLDALVEVYAGLGEDDLFYGTWRRRCQFVETNAALSYEQNGIWDKAQQMYEAAQIKARTGAIPFSQGEYMLWEDHWVICAQKLQQWDILNDFAKHENFNDLLLECAWRQQELWQGNETREQLDSVIKGLMDAPTPRRAFFQAFMSLLRLHGKTETVPEFNRLCDEAIQLSIRKWHQLPKRITNAHIPILQNFQQLVELHDASLICSSLAQTNQQNLDTKSQELKLLLGTWRDRLPNVWDDINAWQDLVTWRQHIFSIVNQTYLNLIPQQGGAAASNSFAYRGYHETAWIINRFAHVARKHQLPEVCINQLGRIYTLPNIEIQEAFLKLREQAKCHYQNPAELNSGLDVINNTNLNYFGAQQKAEFFTLKGMFLAKLDHKEEANDAYGLALYYDLKLPKAWAEWGHYNDNLFKEKPNDIVHGAAAVSCYLEAAGLFKNSKSRKLLSRILWLLSLDDANSTIADAYEAFKGETPVWYWITFIPQLLVSLSHREARLCKQVLVKIAKAYPQALYFLLRTSREDMLTIKKQQEAKQEKAKRAGQGSPSAKQSSPSTGNQTPQTKAENLSRPNTANGEVNGQPNNSISPKQEPNGQKQPSPSGAAQASSQQANKEPARRNAWEYTDEITSILKAAFPLLALSMETMVDQIQKHFKCPPDEDAYRLIVALLNDGLSYVGRMPTSYAQDVKLPPATEANITRFAETVLPAHIRKSFEADFVTKKPTMHEYIQKLRRWRDKFEEKLDRRPSTQSLEQYSPHLSEFRFQKFEEVDVPGQYLQLRDKHTDFVRIECFLPNVDLVRSIGVCHRRLKIRGHDGSIHPFAIQHPAARHCRREERILQLFRIFNGILAKRKESRRRNLNFHLPLMIPLAPHIRLVQDDTSYISLQGVYEDHCRRNGMNKDEPVLFTMEKLRALADMKNAKYPDSQQVRMEAYTAIQEKLVPSTIALEYFQATYPSYADFWLFRRQFSYQMAALTFMTYVMHMNNRYPHKMSIARSSGNIWGSELIPAMAAGKAVFHNPEPVPFRLTPNLQTLMGPLATEGIFGCAIMAIARCLTEPEFDLEQHLSLFVRDEMNFWFTQQSRGGGAQEHQLRETVMFNSNIVVKKAMSLAQPPVGNLPANQTVIDLISSAVMPQKLAMSDALWMPYL